MAEQQNFITFAGCFSTHLKTSLFAEKQSYTDLNL